MPLIYNTTLPTVYSSFDHRPVLSNTMSSRCVSHWGDHYPHTLTSPRQTIFTHGLLIPPSTSIHRFDSVTWAPNTSSPGQLRRFASHSLRKDFNESFWLSQHLKHVAIRDLITSLTSHASPTLPAIKEHVNQAPVGGMPVREKIERSQYFKYHLTTSGRPSRFFPRLLDGSNAEAPSGVLMSAGLNMNAKRDASRVLEDVIERKLPKMEQV